MWKTFQTEPLGNTTPHPGMVSAIRSKRSRRAYRIRLANAIRLFSTKVCGQPGATSPGRSSGRGLPPAVRHATMPEITPLTNGFRTPSPTAQAFLNSPDAPPDLPPLPASSAVDPDQLRPLRDAAAAGVGASRSLAAAAGGGTGGPAGLPVHPWRRRVGGSRRFPALLASFRFFCTRL